jgi:large conductance mechanosensitive channel
LNEKPCGGRSRTGLLRFLTVALNFLIIAWVLFLAIKGIMKLKREEPAAPAPGPTAEVELLTEIRCSRTNARLA